MCVRVAEINEDAIAHVLRDEAVKAAYRRGDAGVIAADDLAQVLGVEPRRKSRRTDEVAEHHRQLPPLGLLGGRGLGSGNRRGGSGRGSQSGDRFQQPTAVAERGNANFLQFLGRQARQQIGSNVVLGKGRRILLQAKAAQPRRNVHAPPPAARAISDRLAPPSPIPGTPALAGGRPGTG
jgi:hypothetical protein